MRYRRLLLSSACAAGMVLTHCSARAQGFTFVAADTLLMVSLGDEAVFNTTVRNTGPSPITIAFVRTLNDLPSDWQSSMCFSLCFAPFIDSIATTSAYGSSPVNPGDSRQFSLHVLSQTNPGTGVVRIVAKDAANPSNHLALTFRTTASAAAAPGVDHLPTRFSLSQNYPNPFNPSTAIGYELSAVSCVTLKVYDVLGREVASLADENKPAGSYIVRFDGGDIASGVYVYRLFAGSFVATRKLVLQK